MGGVAAGAMGLGIVISLRDYASKGIDALREKVHGLQGATEEMSRSFAQGAMDVVRGGAMMAGGAMLLAKAFGAPIEAAMNFETTMAEVNKVADFSADEYASMSEGLRELARNIPMSVEELGSIAAAAAQSGVAKDQLLDFAEQAAYMGVAFDLAGGQAGQMMADWRAGMGLTLPQVYSLADAVNYLSNNMNATAPALGEVIQRVGAAAMSCGLAEKEVAALGAAFLSAGASPEIAATALKSFTSTLARGAAMSKGQAEAFRALGFSAEQLAADMQTNAKKTIFSVLQALSQAPAETRMSLLSQMFGQESIGAIAPLFKNMDNLGQAFELVGSEADYAGSMLAEYKARADTTENSIALLKNRIKDLKIAFGSIALGPFGVVIDVISGIVGLVAKLPKPVLAVIAGLAALAGTALVLMGTFSAIVGILKMWNVAVLTAKAQAIAAFANVKGIVMSLGSALTKGPLLGVSHLAIAAGLLYLAWRTNFLGMRDAVTAFTEGFKMAVSASKDGIAEVDEETYQSLQKAGLWDLSVTMGRVLWRARQFIEGFAEGVRNVWDGVLAAWESVSTAIGKVMKPFRPLLTMLGLLNSAGETNADNWRKWGRFAAYFASALLAVIVAVKAFAIAKGIFKGVHSAVLLMNRAILANPMGVALALVVAILTWVILNWDTLKATAIGVMDAVSNAWTGWCESAKGIFTGVVDWITSVFSRIFDAITSPFKSAFDTVKGWWGNLKSFIFGDNPTLALAGAEASPSVGGAAVSTPVVSERGAALSAPVLATRSEVQARQNAAAAAQNPPANINSNVNVSVEPQTTVLNLDGREISRAVTRHNAHENKRRGKE